MHWPDVFEQPWFWIAAAMFWAHSARHVCGVPRKLLTLGLRDADAAALSQKLLRHHLGPGDLFPRGLRLPIIGAAAALGAVLAFQGDALAAGLTAACGPLAVLRAMLDDKFREAARLEPQAAARRLDQLWRLKVAATALSGLLTLLMARWGLWDGGLGAI